MNNDQHRKFMEEVVPWPAANAPGYVNLHYNVVNYDPTKNGGKPWVSGKPFKTVGELIRHASWIETTGRFFNVWYCWSLQRDTAISGKGKLRAKRSAQGAISTKALWVDIDVRPDCTTAKHYKTEEEAAKAVLAFCANVGLPFPSAIVRSGAGLHVYWIADAAMPVDQWRKYAHGLKNLLLARGIKCDAGLTTDIARILRVPGTKNHKYDPPAPVELLHFGKLYNFATDLACLTEVGVSQTAINGAAASSPARVAEIAAAFDNAVPDPAFASLTDGDAFPAGVTGPHRVDPAPIFAQCGFLREALLAGGKGYDNPLWNLSVLCSTFMENGNALAHAISKGHATYTQADTQALYDRKMVDRADRGIGYPSCATIAGNGCTSCATCPLLGKVKSPLNIRSVVTATVNPSEEPAQKFEPTSRVPKATAGAYVDLNPVARLMALQDQGADIGALFTALNEAFAVTKYGGQIVIARLFDRDVTFMTVDDFHRMFANLVIFKQEGTKTVAIKVSRRWFEWKHRRQYLGRGVVFEPGCPLDIPNDMLNLWRGFGVTPKPGNWALLRSHMFNVVCSGNQQHFDYLIGLLAHRVQNLGMQTGVAVALLGAPGVGKGVLARTFGHFFGKHFAHITHGDQLIGRFNAALGTASTVFLDEALWAGDKKGEGVLKALITEPQFQLEAKFRDPIMVKNLLFIMVASNNDWAIPAGMGDRRWFVLDVAGTYAGLGHQAYFAPLYAEIENGGAAAMLYHLLNMDLTAFDVRAIPHTAAKAKQQALSLHGSLAWLYDALQEGSIGNEQWQDGGLTIDTDRAYTCYVEFSKRQRDWKPEIKSVWSKNIRAALGLHITPTRPTKGNMRVRSFQFAPLDVCRRQFASHLCAPDLAWETENQPNNQSPELPESLWDCEDTRLDALDTKWEPETDPEPEYRIEDGPSD
jgi:hypothetical protein